MSTSDPSVNVIDDSFGVPPMILRFAPAISLTTDDFYALAQENEGFDIERNSRGEIEVMTPDWSQVLRFTPLRPLHDQAFYDFVDANEEVCIERDAQGVIEIMSPTYEDSGERNAILSYYLCGLALADGTGRSFDSSTKFEFPSGAIRSPDASWASFSRIPKRSGRVKGPLPNVCPEFVAELRSSSDRLETLFTKLEGYRTDGVLLGWLIDPFERRVYVYRPNQTAEPLDNPTELSGENVLPGFRLPLEKIFD